MSRKTNNMVQKGAKGNLILLTKISSQTLPR
jgi:hypothetical protein